MNAIRIRKRIDSETVHLPELRSMIGKEVEIIVLEEISAAADAIVGLGAAPDTTPYDKFFELAGKIDYDFDAYRSLGALDLE